MLTLSKNYASCEQRRVPIPPLQGEFPLGLQIYVSFFSKIAPLASGVRLKTRFGDGPGALADSYAVENPNVDFEDLSHTSQRTKSCLQPSRRCGIIVASFPGLLSELFRTASDCHITLKPPNREAYL